MNILLLSFQEQYTVKKSSRVSRLQPGCHKPNSPWAGIIQLWRHYSRPGEFGIDIPVGDGKLANFFLRCIYMGLSRVPQQGWRKLSRAERSWLMKTLTRDAYFLNMKTDQTLPGREKIELFPVRNSLVSDIPAGDGKIANLFFIVYKLHFWHLLNDNAYFHGIKCQIS